MEKYDKSLEEVISCIKTSKEYQTCMTLKEKMKDNSKIQSLVKEIKKTQKEYVKSSYDKELKKKLDELEEELCSIPIYHIYNENLEKVNEMILYVKDSLNDYFTELLNQ